MNGWVLLVVFANGWWMNTSGFANQGACVEAARSIDKRYERVMTVRCIPRGREPVRGA